MMRVDSHRGETEWSEARVGAFTTGATLVVTLLTLSCGTTSDATSRDTAESANQNSVAAAFPPDALLTPAHVDVRRKECLNGTAQSCRLLGLVLARLGQRDEASAAFARGCRGGAGKACVEWGDASHGAAFSEANQRGCDLDEAKSCVRLALHTDDVKAAQHARRKACRLDAVTCAQIAVQALNEEMTLLRAGRPAAGAASSLSDRCDTGDGAACFQLASWKLGKNSEARFKQACDLGLEAGCARAAETMAPVERELEDSAAVERELEGSAPTMLAKQCRHGFARACALERLRTGKFNDDTLADVCQAGEVAACTWLGYRQRYGLNGTTIAPLAAKETWTFACRQGAELACQELQSWFGRYQSGSIGRLLAGSSRLTAGQTRGLRRPLSRTAETFREEFFIGAYRRECEAKNLDACVLLVLMSERDLGPARTEYAAVACERSPAACRVAQDDDATLAERACAGGVTDSCGTAMASSNDFATTATVLRNACLVGTHSACATLLEQKVELGDDVLAVACGLEIGAGCAAVANRRLAKATTNAQRIAVAAAFQIACDLDDAASCLEVARYRLKLRRETEKTIETLRTQCLAVVDGTCALLGETMSKGRYVETDAEVAFWAFERSCLQRSVLSSCSMAVRLVEEGRFPGGPQSLRRVAERAALIFVDEARVMRARSAPRSPDEVEPGRTRASDDVQRLLLLAQKSRVLGCRGGDGHACAEVAREKRGEGTEASLVEARRYALSACSAAESSGCELAAELLSTGTGGPVDKDGAESALRMQCERGGSCASYSNALEAKGDVAAAFAASLVDCEHRATCDRAVVLVSKMKRRLTDIERVAFATYVAPKEAAQQALRHPDARWRDLLITRCTTRVTSETERAVCDAARTLARQTPLGSPLLQRDALQRIDGALCLKSDARACKRVEAARTRVRP